MDKVRAEAQRTFDKLSWPQQSWESWRRTPLEKFQPEERFREYASFYHDKGQTTVPSPIVERGQHLTGWALEVHRVSNAWDCYRTAEAEKVELYDWGTSFPEKASRVLEKRIQGLTDRLQAWNLAYPTQGLLLRIPPHTRISEPILIQFEERGESFLSLPHLLILMGKDAEAQVVVRFDGRKVPGIFYNGGITYQGEANSQGTLVVDRLLPSEGEFFLSFEGYLQQDSTLQSLEVNVGGILSKTTWKVALEEAGAKGDLRGAYVVSPGSHIEMELTQAHQSGRTQSNSLYKGVIASGGKSVFQGLIVVDEGAVKTDAYLANRNLLLGSGARADSIPRLVIGNNDVRCTHGSTTGKLNENQLFYLRSRGLPDRVARRILVEGFFEEVVSKIPEIYQEDVAHRIADFL